ncbi:LysR substrate-binding domain-containing protein [Aliiroseovarius sp. PTFE2010]|uniref:hydrogen peroxide-inducible genes activator n=1 Tax=Aliiroseovarius sp. PTFE2010 TaxID=3417190 RepID=UPI003CE6AC21
MKNITLRQLRYFDALAKHRHFGHAAEACSISQPALSVQMKELESMFGVPLIERGPRNVRLTSVGEDLVARARGILQSVDELGDLARTAKGPLAGRLRLGVIPTVGPYLLPETISHLTAKYPELDLELRETITPNLVRALLEGRLDIALVALPVSEPGLSEAPLFEEEFVLVRPLADAGKPVPRPDNLREMRLLLLEEGHCFRDQALSFCNLTQSAPRDLMEGSSLTTLVQMVGSGIGVTLIPEMATKIEAASAPVSFARLLAPRPKRKIGMVWRKASPLADNFAQVADELRDQYARVRMETQKQC